MDVARRICLDKAPRVFICRSRGGASTLGSESNSFVLVDKFILKALSTTELEAILAHEVAHIKARHVEYYTLLTLIFEGFQAALGGSIAINVLATLLFKKWQREAELSADRGSLIVVEDPSPIKSALLKLHGWDGTEGVTEFLERVKPNTLEEVAHAFIGHPPIEERLKALEDFHESPKFREVLPKMEKNSVFHSLLKG